MNLKFAIGFDIHKLVSGRKLKLCGVEIPFEKGLLGHSDGDVGLHALIDAILSASGLPDIGTLFPDTDSKYKDIESSELLKETLKLINKKNFKVVQVDITIVCDHPKIFPYYAKMKNFLANFLEIDSTNIGIKARTTEGLINKQAIACFCLVVLQKLVF